MKRFKEIFLESDISLACTMLGLGLIFWGCVAIYMNPADFFSFSEAMKFGTTWMWFANYAMAGCGFIWAAHRKFPPALSLLVGTHACLVWTWIASVRGFSNVTSGITLNAIVICMGALLIQRSGKR